jgi:putative transposase
VKALPVPCPHRAATATTAQPRRTARGYRTFHCRTCRRIGNERTGTPYNHLQYPTDLVLPVVLWRLRYTLRLRDLAAMFLERGFVFSHEAARDWEARFAPLLADRLRAKRRGQGGAKWHADETYVRVNGAWCHRYRAIDRDGNLVDALSSEQRDMAAGRLATSSGLSRSCDDRGGRIGKTPQKAAGRTSPRVGEGRYSALSPHLPRQFRPDHHMIGRAPMMWRGVGRRRGASSPRR